MDKTGFSVAEIDGAGSLATVAGHYRDHEGDIGWLTEEGCNARKAAGDAAKAKFKTTGEVDYLKGVDQPDAIERAMNEIVPWFRDTAKTTSQSTPAA